MNYQINLTKTITMRVERRKTKTGSFIHKTTRAKISLQVVNFSEISLYSEIFTVGTVNQCWLLFHCSLLLLFTLYYSISSCFDILHSRLAEIDRKPYEIDGNQPEFVMIGLTRRFGFQFLQKLQKQPQNAISRIVGTLMYKSG